MTNPYQALARKPKYAKSQNSRKYHMPPILTQRGYLCQGYKRDKLYQVIAGCAGFYRLLSNRHRIVPKQQVSRHFPDDSSRLSTTVAQRALDGESGPDLVRYMAISLYIGLIW